jgi:leucyl-tRNA synthetase
MCDKLERLYKFVVDFVKTRDRSKSPEELSSIDKWMISRLQEHIRKTTEAMDKLAVRKAIHNILYELEQDFQWYQRRVADRKNINAYVIGNVMDAQVRMLAPIAPHTCEEMWQLMNGKDFVALSPWPTPDESKTDAKVEEEETLIMSVLEDTLNIIKATNIKPKKICYYTSAPWKWKAYQKILEKSVSAKVLQKDLMKDLMGDSELKAKADKVAKFTSQIIDEINHMPEERKQRLAKIGIIDENHTLKNAAAFFKRELDAEIHVNSEEDAERYDPKQRAQIAKPYRPAIFIE